MHQGPEQNANGLIFRLCESNLTEAVLFYTCIHARFNGTLQKLHAMLKLLDKSHTDVHKIAYILGTVSIFGYIISFLRDRAFAHYFGPSELLDIYIASFRIPDTLFIIATAFISVYAILPMFEQKQKQGKNKLQEFINTSFYFLVLFLVFGVTALFFAIPFLADTLFQSFSGDARDTFVSFSRIFLIQEALFAVSSFFTAILQLKRKFFLYSLLPILYNVGIIAGVVFLYPIYGTFGLAGGVVLGALMSVCIQIPIILRNRIMPILAPTKQMLSETWRAVKLSVPRASALLSHGVGNIIIFSVIVSLSEGALSVYYFAENLKTVPLIIVGTAYAVATFPILVNYCTENKMDKFRETIESAFRRLFFFIFPLIAYIFILREPLISFFFETGYFTEETTFITGTMLGMFVFSALAMSVLIICARALYACGRSLLPFLVFFALSVAEVVGVFAVVEFLRENYSSLTIILEWTNLTTGGFGILFATIATIVVMETIAGIAIFIILMRIIKQRIAPIARSLFEHALATGVFATVIVSMQVTFFSDIQYNTFEGACALIAMTAIGTALWYIVLLLLKNKESDIVREQMQRCAQLIRRN